MQTSTISSYSSGSGLAYETSADIHVLSLVASIVTDFGTATSDTSVLQTCPALIFSDPQPEDLTILRYLVGAEPETHGIAIEYIYPCDTPPGFTYHLERVDRNPLFFGLQLIDHDLTDQYG